MSPHGLLNLLNELRNSDKMPGLMSSLAFFRNEFNKFNNKGLRMLDDIIINQKSHFWHKRSMFCHLTQRYYITLRDL